MPLTPADAARYPRPGTAIPGRIGYTPDGRSVTYLFSERGDLARDLWRLDLATGERRRAFVPPGEGVTEANVSREEALRRERLRLRETGVTDYLWAKEAPVLLVPLGEQLYRVQGDGVPEKLTTNARDPKLSKDGRRVYFVRDAEVWCLDERGERQLTSGAEPGLTNGLAEYIAQEELGRLTGYWPSPDGAWVAFEQADERHIPVYPIVHQAANPVEVEEHRYPFAGAANARVRLGVVPVDGGSPTWLDLGPGADLYLARVDWHPDGRLFVQLLDRAQRRLELWAYQVPGGERRLLLVEETEPWVNLHDDLRFVEPTGELVWSSERSGFRHLYLYDAEGHLLRQLTDGDWPVDAVHALDAERRVVYFAAGRASPLERRVYGVPLDGGAPVELTPEPGWHEAVFAPDCSSFVDTHDSLEQPPGVVVRRIDGEALRLLHAPATVEPPLRPPTLHSFANRDGVVLHAAVYAPPGGAAPTTPVIVSVYGGPHAQLVRDSWALTVDLRAQLLAEHGFVVLKVDNRGSARRGLAFEAPIHLAMGSVEVRDQVDGVRWLCGQGWGDASRVGIYGWSYGGYVTLRALVTAPELFGVGVAGAPVTSWDGYDTGYTERYMATPASNPDGYDRSSVLTHAGRLEGKLLLVHGMIDENVHFRHTARLVDALIKAGRPHDLLIYPSERHMPRSEKDRTAMEAQILGYFERHL